MTLTMLS